MEVPPITIDGIAAGETLRILATLPGSFGVTLKSFVESADADYADGLRELVKKCAWIVLHPEVSDCTFFLENKLS